MLPMILNHEKRTEIECRMFDWKEHILSYIICGKKYVELKSFRLGKENSGKHVRYKILRSILLLLIGMCRVVCL